MSDVVKVTLNGSTLIDHSDATIEPDKVLQNYIGYEGDGDRIVGTATGGSSAHTVTIIGGDSTYAYAKYPGSSGTKYTSGSFEFEPGDTIYVYIRCSPISPSSNTSIFVDGVVVSSGESDTRSYTYTLPDHDVIVDFHVTSWAFINIWTTEVEANKEITLTSSPTIISPTSPFTVMSQVTATIGSNYVEPSGTYSISANGTYDIFSYASVNVDISGGGGSGDYIEARRSLSNYYSTNSQVRDYEFYGISNLKTVSMPSCSVIGNYAFYNCASLSEISFPSCSNIGQYAFYICYKLSSTIEFSNCLTIGQYGFYNCSKIQYASFPKCSSINGNAFAGCSSLSGIYAPSCKSVGANAFYLCNNLLSVDFPICTIVNGGGFSNCLKLSYVSMPSCSTLAARAFMATGLLSAYFPECKLIYSSAFAVASSLTTASFPMASMFSASAFTNCYHLLSLYLLGSSVPTLQNVNVFLNSPISTYTSSTGGVNGSIFVRASLYDAFISATNWATYSARIVSLTDAQIAALSAS